jgi:molybdenum cofactor biosynthesis enzyme MoaA
VHDALKYTHHLLRPRSEKWHPFLCVFYLNFHCNFRCFYCSNGKDEPYYTHPPQNISFDVILESLKALRKHCAHLEITGGEPLTSPHFQQLLQTLPSLNFKQTILTTNGYYLDRFPGISQSFDTLVVSLDTLNPEKGVRFTGRPRKDFLKVLSNLETLSHPQIVISSVMTPENLDDIYEVMDFAFSKGFQFAAYPQLAGVHSPDELKNNSRFMNVVEHMIQAKKKGKKIFPTLESLRLMKHLSPFRCRPFTIVSMEADGTVYYPCLEQANAIGNIREHSLHQLKKKGIKEFGFPQCSGSQCHSACSLGFSQILNRPFSMMHEALLLSQQKFRRRP